MDTAMKHTQTHVTAPDFETRLMIAGAGIDAVLAHKHGLTLEQTQAAVSDAEGTSVQQPRFQPHPVLAKARQIIENRGWVQGMWNDGVSGAVCARSAVQLAAGLNSRAAFEAERELLHRIADELGSDSYSIPMWNDRCQDVSQVFKLLY